MAERESFPEGVVNTPDAPGGYPLGPSIRYEPATQSPLLTGTSTEEQKRRAEAGELNDGEQAEADTTGAQEAISGGKTEVGKTAPKRTASTTEK